MSAKWGRKPLVDLKVGDAIAVVNSSWASRIDKCTVERVTKTLIIDNHDRRWRNKDGYRQGRSEVRYNVQHIEPWSEDHARSYLLQQRATRWSNNVYTIFEKFKMFGNIPDEKQMKAASLMRELVALLEDDKS